MLLHLPDELLLAITSHLTDPPSLQSLACTSARLYTVVLPVYYRTLARTRRCEPLVAAAVHGNVGAVRVLLGEGCRPGGGRGYSFKKKYGRGGALVVAIEKGREDIAELVLEYGADPNAQAGKVGNALEAACQGGMVGVVRALLVRGADVRFEGGKALRIAAEKGLEEVVGLLLDHGAEAAGEGCNALRVAAVHGRLGCVKVLLERGVDVNYRTVAQGRAFEAALEAGHEDVARFLLQRGAEDKLVDGLDDRWLPGAAFNIVSKDTRYSEFLDTILDRMDYSSQLAGNAFVSVARDGNEHLVEFFLRKGVDVEKHGPRALGVAAVKGHLQLLHRLIDAGVDVNREVPKRGHAILRAAKHGYVACVKLLLEKGASPNVVHGTPYIERRSWSTLVFCSTPLQAACWGGECLSADARVKFDRTARILLEAGADPNVSGGRWFQPLGLAAYQGSEHVVRLLLKHGADPSARGPVWGDNALQAAVMRRSIDIVRVLLEAGAKVDGSGALQVACGAVYPYEGNLTMVKLLLEYGADPNDKSEAYATTGYINALSGAPGTSTWSALQCARRNRNNRNAAIIQLLLDSGARDED